MPLLEENATLLTFIAASFSASMAAIIGPIVVAIISGRQRRRDRAEDRMRLDAQSALVNQSAADLLFEQQTANRRVARIGEITEAHSQKDHDEHRIVSGKVEHLATVTGASLDAIHSLVNSDMTNARAAELEQTELALGLMIKLHQIMPPSLDEENLMRLTKSRIEHLRQILDERAAVEKRLSERERLPLLLPESMPDEDDPGGTHG